MAPCALVAALLLCCGASVLAFGTSGGIQDSELDPGSFYGARTTVERQRVLRRASILPRFRALDALSVALYSDLSKGVAKISEEPRAAFQPSADRPPVIIFSDACLPTELGGPVVVQKSSGKGPCKLASSVTIAALRKSIAAQTARAVASGGVGVGGAFLCEFKAESRFVHCVLKPRRELPEFRSALNISALPPALPAKAALLPPSDGKQPSARNASNATAVVGPSCSFSLDRKGAFVVPAMATPVGDNSSATLYVSCPGGKAGRTVLASSADLSRLRASVIGLLRRVRNAACHCSVNLPPAPDALSDAPPPLPELLCKCARVGARKAGGPRAAGGGKGVVGNVSRALRVQASRRRATHAQLYERWQRVVGALSNSTAEAAFLDARMAALRSHTLAGPVIAGGQRGVSSAGVSVDAAAAEAAQVLDVFAKLSARPPPDTDSSLPRQFSSTTGGIWGVGGASAPPLPPSGSAGAATSSDSYYRQLAIAAVNKVTPAHTAAAAADAAALQQLLQQYIVVTDDIDAVAPPLDSAKNRERLTQKQQEAQLPPVVRSHLMQLQDTQRRLRRDISLAASRIDATPNIDPQVVVAALQAVSRSTSSRGFRQTKARRAPTGSNPAAAGGTRSSAAAPQAPASARTPDSAAPPGSALRLSAVALDDSSEQLVEDEPARRRTLSSGGGKGSSTSSASYVSALSTMFVSGPRAGLCAVWPRCLSLLGGTGLQSWLMRRVREDTSAAKAWGHSAVPSGDECADGGVSSTPATGLPGAREGPRAGLSAMGQPPPNGPEGTAGSSSSLALARIDADGNSRSSASFVSAAAARLLVLRGWCDGPGPLRAVRDVTALVDRVVRAQNAAAAAAARNATRPRPAAANRWGISGADKNDASPSPSPSPDPPMGLLLSPLVQTEALTAAAAVAMSGTSVRPAPLPKLVAVSSRADPDAFLELASPAEERQQRAALLRFLGGSAGAEDGSYEASSAIDGLPPASSRRVVPPPSPPSYDAVLRELSLHADASSLLLRFNGTLACLCLFVSAPVRHLGVPFGAPSVADEVEAQEGRIPPSVAAVLYRDFPADVQAARAPLRTGAAGAAAAAVARSNATNASSALSNSTANATSSPANGTNASAVAVAAAMALEPPLPPLRRPVPAPLPPSSTGWFAHAAEDVVQLPPASSLEVSAWLRRRLELARRAAQARRRAVLDYYARLRRRLSPTDAAELGRLEALRKQLTAELARVRDDLLRKRIKVLIERLTAELARLRVGLANVQSRVKDTRARRLAALAAAESQRDEQLRRLRALQDLLAQVRGLGSTADTGSDARVAGCQGGGGSAGAALARRQAAALERLAQAQLRLQAASFAAAQAAIAGSATQRNATLATVSGAQDAVDGAHASVLSLALVFDMATCSCVARVTGVPCATGITNSNKTGTAPAEVLAAGGSSASKAMAATDGLLRRLQGARAALDAERRRWEEAVVRLARPKTCLQLQALAIQAPDGLYTVFPPDDLQYRGVRVYCDMTTDGGGWTLVAHAPRAALPGPLGVASASLPGQPISGSNPADRSRAWNLNSLWVVQASREAALAWTPWAAPPNGTDASLPPPPMLRGGANSSNATANASGWAVPTGGLATYGAAIAWGLPAPRETTLALSPPPLPQPCSSASGEYAPVDVRCLALIVANGTANNSSNGTAAAAFSAAPPPAACAFPARMYTGTTSLGVCSGRAYGVILSPTPAELCDGPLGLAPRTGGIGSAPPPRTVAGAMLSVDAFGDCAGVLPVGGAGGPGRGFVPGYMALWMR